MKDGERHLSDQAILVLEVLSEGLGEDDVITIGGKRLPGNVWESRRLDER
jgi:hypothetical protein